MPIEKIRDDLYVKKGLTGYRVVYPIKKDLNNSLNRNNINWYNLLTGGSIWKLIKVVLFVALIILSVIAYQYDVGAYEKTVKEIFSDPYGWCAKLSSMKASDYPDINWSKLNIEVVNDSIVGKNKLPP